MLGALVDSKALIESVVAAVVAALGVTFAFSVAIYGAARSSDLFAGDRPVAGTAAALLAAVGLLTCAAAVVVGIIAMVSK